MIGTSLSVKSPSGGRLHRWAVGCFLLRHLAGHALFLRLGWKAFLPLSLACFTLEPCCTLRLLGLHESQQLTQLLLQSSPGHGVNHHGRRTYTKRKAAIPGDADGPDWLGGPLQAGLSSHGQ